MLEIGKTASLEILREVPMGVMLVGVAWLPGRVLSDSLGARNDRYRHGLGDLLVGPGQLSVEVALSLALLVPVFVPSFLLGASLAGARASYAGALDEEAPRGRRSCRACRVASDAI